MFHQPCRFLILPILLSFIFSACHSRLIQVGSTQDGLTMVPTHQMLRPAGDSVQFSGRPVDLALSQEDKILYVKDNRGIVVIDNASWTIRQELGFAKNDGGSMHGIVTTKDGSRVYVTTAQNRLWEAKVLSDGSLAWSRSITLPGPKRKGASHACGMALSPDETLLWVCLSRNNSLGRVDLEPGELLQEIPVGVAPFDLVLSSEGRFAYVSNWGGRLPHGNERTAKSSGTDVIVDERGIAASGSVSKVDLLAGREVAQCETGLHPSDLELSRDGKTLFSANANSDTVSVITTDTMKLLDTLSVRPNPQLPFGSAPNALALDDTDHHLYVANGGNNAIAVLSLRDAINSSNKMMGFIPTGWYPGGIVTDGRYLYIANVKGLGSRRREKNANGWHVSWSLGTVQKVAIPSPVVLQRYTHQVHDDFQIPQSLRAWEKKRDRRKKVPVPRRPDETSVFEHVVYIIKENRTYDQVFGDLPYGNNDPNLCIFGREVTPNQHALAEQFVLLDNYYCNGVNSADGHSWATEGYVTDHLEKSFGGFTRSYTWGDDPLNYSSSGFIWDNALLHGLTFRNYGEMDYAATIPADAAFTAIYQDFLNQGGQIQFSQNIGIEALQPYTCKSYPGWNLHIPDVLRAERFLQEFREYEKKKEWPNLILIYLPNDHTSGTAPGAPTPRAQVADNDLALGKIIEAITQSVFWPETCIFVNEDDPQDGFDHVDGHRSTCLVISPYTKRGAIISRFYNQTSVLHTMERILGIPPMNQMDSLAPLMDACFTAQPDYTPYTGLPNRIPLDEMNPDTEKLSGEERYWAMKSQEAPLDRFDQIDEDIFNRILWHSVKGVNTSYPAHLAGAHGTGLKKLHLQLVDEE